MAKTLTFQIDADEAKQLEAAVDECISEMQQANQRMDERQARIEQLKSETRAMLEQIRQMRAV
jgi:uncharacterized coiled-coil DUF342 family protein